MCLFSGLIMFDRCERKNSYLLFIAKTLAYIDQMDLCFSCKTEDQNNRPMREELLLFITSTRLFIYCKSKVFCSIPQPNNVIENSEKKSRILGLTRMYNTKPEEIQAMMTLLSKRMEEKAVHVEYRYFMAPIETSRFKCTERALHDI